MTTQDTQGWPPESELDAGDASETQASGRYPTERGVRWYSCDKCGFLFPDYELMRDPVTGLLECTTGPNDYDAVEDDPRIKGLQFSRTLPDEEILRPIR
jgi:hypothetical protein